VVVVCCQFDKYINTAGNLDKIKSMAIQAAEKGANIILFGEFALENKDAPEPIPGPSSEAMVV
jgi:predicted amidohydrolase